MKIICCPIVRLVIFCALFCGCKALEYTAKISFQCGCKNQFLSRDGEWHTDKNPNAVCLHGKADILKYCQKMYPKPQYNVSNIAELFDEAEIKNWRPTDPNAIKYDCKYKFSVRPYECISDQPKNDAPIADIPDGCSLDHSEDRTACQDYKFWTRKSRETCAETFANSNKIGVVKWLKVLDPCGLDLFSSHEYLCCPVPDENDSKKLEKITTISAVTRLKVEAKDEKSDTSDSEDSSQEEEGALEEDESSVTIDASKIKPKNRAQHDENDEWARKNLNLAIERKKPPTDEYYRSADLHKEHVRYQQARARLERRHKRLVAMIMQEWDRLEKKYNSMSNKQSQNGQKFRKEMIQHYQSSIVKIEEETSRQRHKLSAVHEKRMLADFHAHYRSIDEQLATSIEQRRLFPNDRTSEARLLNSSHALIRLVEKFRLYAIDQYRRIFGADPVEASTNHRAALIDFLIGVDLNLTHSLGQLDVLDDTRIEQDIIEFWQSCRYKLSSNVPNKSLLQISNPGDVEKLVKFYEENMDNRVTKKSDPSKSVAKATNTDKIVDSLLLADRMQQNSLVVHESSAHVERSIYLSYCIFFVSGIIILIVFVAVILTVRRNHQNHMRGFVKIDACTPEERHVAKMQVNGYQNPTYKYFDQ